MQIAILYVSHDHSQRIEFDWMTLQNWHISMMCIAIAGQIGHKNVPCVSIMMMVGRLMVMVLFIQSRFNITATAPVAGSAAAAIATAITFNISAILVLMPVQMMVLMLLIAHRCIWIVTLHFVHVVCDEWIAGTVATVSNANISEIIVLIECLQYLLGDVRATGDIWRVCHR